MDFKKQLTISLILAFAVSAILIAALFFFGNDIVKRIGRVGQSRQELDLRIRSVENAASLHQDYSLVQSYAPELENVLIGRDRLLGFPRDLGIIARQSQIDLNASLGAESSKDGALGATAFTLNGGGSLEGLINFLKRVETSRYFVRFNALDFGRRDDKFKLLITGQVFSF